MNIIIISIIAIIALGAIVMIGTKLFGGKNDEPIVVPAFRLFYMRRRQHGM